MPKRFSKRKLQLVNTKTNRPVHSQPTSSETYNPYAVIVPSTSVFLLELTVNTCRKKERPPTTLVAILNVRARSRGHASTNQTFFASERACALKNRKPKKWHPVFDYPRVRGISIPLTVNARGLWGRDCVGAGACNVCARAGGISAD